MSSGDTQPTLPLPDDLFAAPAPARRKRRIWPWIVAIVIVVALAVGAWFLGEWIARDLVTKTIRDQVVTQLSLPADQQVDVELSGSVLAQVIAGTLDEVTVASDDVTFGALTGDVEVTATEVTFRGDTGAETASGTLTLDATQVQALLATIDGFPAETVGLEEPNVTMSTELDVFGIRIPIGIAATPSIDEGDVVLTPAEPTVAGADMSADDIKRQFGLIANTVVRDWRVCVAEYIPSGIHLVDARVEGELLVAAFDIDGGIVSDPSLRENGTCA